jgi:hypothetical protein
LVFLFVASILQVCESSVGASQRDLFLDHYDGLFLVLVLVVSSISARMKIMLKIARHSIKHIVPIFRSAECSAIAVMSVGQARNWKPTRTIIPTQQPIGPCPISI